MEAARKILIVDDDPTVRSVVSEMLSILGYEVSTADSGEKGLRIFFKNKFDVVLSDYEMPGMDGVALLTRIKARSPSTLVVLITGAGREVIPSPKASCVDRIMCKPFNLSEIAKALRSISDKYESQHHK
jgi:DNA-binding NtrC family response regulator